MDPSLVHGVFNLDQLSVIAGRIKDCYVIGSFHDYALFLSWFCGQIYVERVHIILRDYEPHYVCLDLWKNDETLHVFVCDSVPDTPVNWKKYAQIDTKMKTLLFFNSDIIQSDDVSCKIFALMAAFRLAKMKPQQLYMHLKSHAKLVQKIGVYVVDPYFMPCKLYRGCQSLKFLDNVYEKATEKDLRVYVEKRLITIIWDENDITQMKQQNRTINRKLQKYGSYLGNSICNKEALGWYLPIPDIKLEKRYAMLCLVSPIIKQMYSPSEAAYKVDADTWLSYQARESDPLAKRDWYENMALLKKDQDTHSPYWLTPPIIQTNTDELAVMACASWWKDHLSLFNDVNFLLTMGCVNLLSMGRIVHLLQEHI